MLDPSAVSESTIRIKAGVIRAYWGHRENVEKDVSISVMNVLTSSATLEVWEEGSIFYTSEQSFAMDVSGFFVNGCVVDSSSFRGQNVDLRVEGTSLFGTLAGGNEPGVIDFVGFAPNTCSTYNYPVHTSVMVVRVEQPSYTLTYQTSTSGCASVHVVFDTPVTANSTAVLNVESTQSVEMIVSPLDALFFSMDVELCITGDSDTLLVSLNHDVVTSISGVAVKSQAPTSIFVSRISLVVSLSSTGLPSMSLNNTYVMREKTFTLTFDTPSSIMMSTCDFSNAFTSDVNVYLRPISETHLLQLEVTSMSIDHHTIEFHEDRVVCNGALAVEFVPKQFKYAYDPPFSPGDIVIVRVNSYYSAEFDFVPLRKVFTWNKIFFTDAGWVNEVYGFIDHGSDGYISWTPKADVEAGTTVQWSYVAMSQAHNEDFSQVINTEYSFVYEMHGFLLDFQDNLFIFATGNHDTSSTYEDLNRLTFIFGVYWSASQWANQTNDYMEITAEYSSLPEQLKGFNVALGEEWYPVPRGVNYMRIKQDEFQVNTNTYTHIIEKITNKTYWETSQRDRFTISPLVSYVERPMDFTVISQMQESIASVCFNFTIRYTIVGNATKIHVAFDSTPLETTVEYRDGLYCLLFARPEVEGVVRVQLDEGAFTYTTTSTITPVTYSMVAYDASFPIYNTPQLTVHFEPMKRLQVLTIESTIPCETWGTLSVNNIDGSVVSNTPSRIMFALRTLDVPAYVSFDAGYCTTEGGMLSDSYVSPNVTLADEPVYSSLLRDVHLVDLKTNTLGFKSVHLRAPESDWTVNLELVADLNDPEMTIEVLGDVLELSFNLTAESLSVDIPAGLFVKNQQRSTYLTYPLDEVYYAGEIDVLESVDLPWKEPVLSEMVRDAIFHLTFAPTVGSSLPNVLLRFENGCRSLGYVMGTTTTVPVAIMDGFCNYGVEGQMIVDSYGNTNKPFEGTVEFDFAAPVGRVALVEEGTTEFPDTEVLYWNHPPVVALFFDEPLANFNESENLVIVDGCSYSFLSHVVVNDRSIVSYGLSDCLEGLVHVYLVEDIVLSDDFGNECLSQDCISGFTPDDAGTPGLSGLSLVFEMDVTRPQIEISTDITILYTDSMDVHFTISEENTQFTCNSIGIAIQDVSVHVTQTDNRTCHYQFTPKPVNGTYIIFFVPEGRFLDRAQNPNVASNTLTPMILNEGARITVDAPLYTSQVQTMFTVSIDYVWLCPNYEYIFPSTFEYDRDVARIEKLSDSVDENGTILETFMITFFNFETFPEDRYKNMIIYIPSMVCSHELGLHNEAVQFMMTFDNTPTIPSFELLPKLTGEENFTMVITFDDVREFGTEEPSQYLSFHFEGDEEPIACEVTREQVNATFIYTSVCPLTKEGDLNITVFSGAVIELTGLASATFSRLVYVDGYPPTITLSAVGSTVFGPAVTSLVMQMSVSELMGSFDSSCFGVSGADDLEVTFSMDATSLTANQNVTVNLMNPHVNEGVVSGNFSIYVREQCVTDAHNNYNLRSNDLVFTYDYVRPTITLFCPAQDMVLNTITITGELSEPCSDLTTDDITVPTTCEVRDITMESSTAFTFTVSCFDVGTFSFGVRRAVDMVGNVGTASNSCSASFTINGPRILYEIHNLLEEQYVNTQEFEIDLWTSSQCVSMNLTNPTTFVMENAEVIRLVQNTVCNWTMIGRNLEEGLVNIRILEGAAVDEYGGLSYSELITFRSYQSTPSIISTVPTVFAANTQNNVTICYDWNIIKGEGAALATRGCSEVVVSDISTRCVTLTVDITVGERCYLYLEEDFVHTVWQLPSVGRYVFLEIDERSPAIDVAVKVGDRELSVAIDTSVPNQQEVFVNNDTSLAITVPSNVEMTLSRLTWQSTCTDSVEVSENEMIDISIHWADVQECDLVFSFAEGFFVDALSRPSSAVSLAIHLSKVLPEVTATGDEYTNQFPVTACMEFNNPVTLTSENVVTLIPFVLNSTEECANLLVFSPAASGEISFTLRDVVDAYGNAMEKYERYRVVYYAEQPVMQPMDPVITSTLNGAESFAVDFVFNHFMADAPDTVQELFVLESVEGLTDVTIADLFTVQSATVLNDTVTVTMTPVETTSFRAVLSLSPMAFVDRAGNTVAPASFEVVVDNEPPQLQSVDIQGGTGFSRLPVTITLTFNKIVTLSSGFASYVTGSLNENTIHFDLEGEGAGLVQSVSLVSTTIVPFVAGDEMTITLAPGSITALNGLLNDLPSTFVLTATDGVLTLVGEPEIPSGRQNTAVLTFNQPVVSVMRESITLVNAAVENITVTGNVVELTFTIMQQGSWSASIAAGAVTGSDDGTNADVIVINGFYDSIAPTVSCELPPAIGVGEVQLNCTFSEPVAERTIFTLMHDDVVLNHVESFDDSHMSMSVVFTAMDERVENYSGHVLISLNECEDLSGNACLPVRYMIPIDMVSPVVTLEATHQYMYDNETITVFATFNKMVTEVRQEYLQVDYDEMIARVVLDSFSVVEEGRRYSWTLTFSTIEIFDQIVPFSIVFPGGLVQDMYGNLNAEATLPVYINEVAPVLSVEKLSEEGTTVTIAVNILNGPISHFTSSMWIASDSVQVQSVVSNTIDISMQYVMTLSLSCTASCEWSIRFLSEMIYNDAGNKLEHDVTFSDVLVMEPVVTISFSNLFCANAVCDFVVHSSEPSDIYCQDVDTSDSRYRVLEQSCLYAQSCLCQIQFVEATTALSVVNLTIPEGVIYTAYNSTNDASGPFIFYHNMEQVKPEFHSEWTPESSILNIPFTLSIPDIPDILTSFSPITEAMIQCTNCEISNFQQTTTRLTYSFEVSFLSDIDRYARVYIEEGVFVDPFNRPSAMSEFILRKDDQKPEVTRIIYHPNSKMSVEIHFSLPVHSCGGTITFTPQGFPNHVLSLVSSDERVQFVDRTAYISVSLLSNATYVLTWDAEAFCDDTNMPSSTDFAERVISTSTGLPMPPTYVSVVTVTATSAVIEYSGATAGGDEIKAVVAVLVPSAHHEPFANTSSLDSGEITLTDLEPNTEYSAVLVTKNSYGYSKPSVSVSFVTRASTPLPVTDIRICSLSNPVTTDGIIRYSEAVACWTASRSADVSYRVSVADTSSGTPGEETLQYEGAETSASISVANDVTAYRVYVETCSILEVEEGERCVTASGDFVTSINLENVNRFPQGAGIEIVAERLSRNEVRISFTHPLENYFPIESYMVQYGNVFDDTFQPSGHIYESYPFRMDKCTGNSVTVTVRASVNGGFYGVPSNRVTVFCSQPRLQIQTRPGYDFVTFFVVSEFRTTATCTIRSVFSPEVVGTQEVEINPVLTPKAYLFKSLDPDTDYTIDCQGYDVDFVPISGSISFYTLSDFVLPEMTLVENAVTEIGASYAKVTVETVNMPGTVYCLATSEGEVVWPSRAQFIKKGFSTYVFPDIGEMEIMIAKLQSDTTYNARCIFDPDFYVSHTPLRRRLVEEDFVFTTASIDDPQWVSFSPSGSVTVPVNAQIVLTAALPVIPYVGSLVLTCTGHPEESQILRPNNTKFVTSGNSITITPLRALHSGYEYVVETTLGLFLDADTEFPLPAISRADKFAFTITEDPTMITEPSLVQSMPENQSVTDLVNLEVYFTFDRQVVVGSGTYRVRVNDETPSYFDVSKLTINNNVVTVSGDLFFPEGARVQIWLLEGSICSIYGSCISTRIELEFTIGNHEFEPSLVSIFPSNGQSRVPSGEDVVMTFNKRMTIREDYVVVLVDEEGNNVALRYGLEKDKVYPRFFVEENKVIIRGSALPAGHTYTVMFESAAFTDSEGRQARGIPSMYSFTTSQYSCSGGYIFEDMSSECSCYLTSTKCECWCGETENPMDVVIRLIL